MLTVWNIMCNNYYCLVCLWWNMLWPRGGFRSKDTHWFRCTFLCTILCRVIKRSQSRRRAFMGQKIHSRKSVHAHVPSETLLLEWLGDHPGTYLFITSFYFYVCSKFLHQTKDFSFSLLVLIRAHRCIAKTLFSLLFSDNIVAVLLYAVT